MEVLSVQEPIHHNVRIMVEDKTYNSWHFVSPDKYASLDAATVKNSAHINPAEQKLFTRDHIDTSVSPPRIISSPIRTQQQIAAILVIENNKTYGKSGKRLLYKCMPDDRHLPAFLVPYEIKMDFNKKFTNKYVVIKFDNWTHKHPHAILVEVLGCVSNIDIFYEYQIYCKSLHESIANFTNTTKEIVGSKQKDEIVQQIISNPILNVERDIHTCIFTIDPANSTDYDDAFSICVCPSDESRAIVNVYIANVFLWLETLGLWKSFSRRVSTIYLPDRRRPMLPTILSDLLCSLQKQNTRFAMRMQVEICKQTGHIYKETATFKNVAIEVAHNFSYESPDLIGVDDYMSLLKWTRLADASVKTSNDLVSFWMVQMNSICGELLASKETGIFRAAQYLNKSKLMEITTQGFPATLSDDCRRLIQNWNNTTGQYCIYDPNLTSHALMNLKSYTHMTSPIRRLVDLLNQIVFLKEFGIVGEVSSECTRFLENWIGQLEYINTAMRSIRKIQTDCEMVKRCYSEPDIMNRIYSGVVFDKIYKNDGTYAYMVYLEEIRLLSRIHSVENIENYESRQFRIFLFEDEDHIKKKIKLDLLRS